MAEDGADENYGAISPVYQISTKSIKRLKGNNELLKTSKSKLQHENCKSRIMVSISQAWLRIALIQFFDQYLPSDQIRT